MALNIKKEFGNGRQLSRKPDLATLVYGKVPPQAPELEEAVLGACMLEKDTFEQIVPILYSEDCFYVDAHQKIYASMRALRDAGNPIDLLTITEQLRKTNELELIGGAYYLTKLTMAVLSSAHAEYHARLIMEKFIQRELIRISGSVISEAYEDETDVFDLLDKNQTELNAIESRSFVKTPQGMSAAVQENLDRMHEIKHSENNYTGIPTCSNQLNEITGGWQKTDANVIAARPSVGKTAFMIENILVAAMSGFPCALFSLEMSRAQIINRMKSNVSGVELKQILNPKQLTDEEWGRVTRAAGIISGLKIYIDDTAAITAAEMSAKVRQLRQKFGVELVGVDYLQLMSGTGKEGNREQEISKISRDLKKMAKSLDIALLELSQLNRGIEGQSGEATRDPRLSDLRESGAIEQDADNVFFLTNPTPKLVTENLFFAGKKLITIAKGRNIGLGQVAMEFNASIQKWKDPKSNEPEFPVSQPPDNPRAGMPGSSKLFIPGGGFQARSPLPPESDDKVPF